MKLELDMSEETIKALKRHYEEYRKTTGKNVTLSEYIEEGFINILLKRNSRSLASVIQKHIGKKGKRFNAMLPEEAVEYR